MDCISQRLSQFERIRHGREFYFENLLELNNPLVGFYPVYLTRQ